MSAVRLRRRRGKADTSQEFREQGEPVWGENQPSFSGITETKKWGGVESSVGAVVETPCFHCQGPRFNPWWGN